MKKGEVVVASVIVNDFWGLIHDAVFMTKAGNSLVYTIIDDKQLFFIQPQIPDMIKCHNTDDLFGINEYCTEVKCKTGLSICYIKSDFLVLPYPAIILIIINNSYNLSNALTK